MWGGVYTQIGIIWKYAHMPSEKFTCRDLEGFTFRIEQRGTLFSDVWSWVGEE